MKAIKKFEEFINEGVVKKQTSDNSRAEFLIKESNQNFLVLNETIKKMSINNLNANFLIKSSHDILMELIRAKMLMDGFNASGFHVHEAEIAYLRKLNFNEADVQFADQIRFFRNGMLYYGNILDKEYAEKVYSFLKKIISKLKEAINEVKKR